MATSTTVQCGVCESRHVTKCADHWCPECEEGLCLDCQEHHSLSKASRKHKLITIENFRNLPVFVADLSENCRDHDMKFTNYCPQHDDICCPVCLATAHQNCTKLRALPDLIQNSKDSALTSMLDDKIQQLQSLICEGMTEIRENQEDVIQAQQAVPDEIRKFRSRINAKLDHLEQTLVQSLTDATKTAKSKIEASSIGLSVSLKHITYLKNSLHAVKEHGSDLQAFFGTRKIDEEIKKEGAKLKKIFKEGRLNRIDISLKLNNEVLDTVSKLTSLGSVSIDINQTSLHFPTRENKEAQIMSVTRKTSASIEDIKLTLLRTIELPTKDRANLFISGCAICPNGYMMFTDHNNSLLIIYDQDGTFQSQIPVTGYPTDVTIIDDTTAAVSTFNNGIQIIDISSKQIKQTITTNNYCFGITFHKGSLLWCEMSVGVQSKLLLEGDVSTLIPWKGLSYWAYLCTFEDNIFVKNPNCAVQCFTNQGAKIWEYKDQTLLPNPWGITTDNDSNLYLASNSSSDVVVMSSDGKRVRQLLSKAEHGLSNPTCLYFDRSRNNILISNRGGSAFLYHID